MASPFRWFRKHQKAMLAVVTLLSMFAFVFFGTWNRLGEPGGKVVNPEVFTWKYGTVRERELRDRKQERQLVAQFLLNAVAAASPPGVDAQQIQYALQQYFPLPLSDEAIEEAMLLDKKAAELGIVVSNRVVNDLIYGFTGNRLSQAQLADLINRMSYGQVRVTQTLLFDAIRMELAARDTKQILLQPYSRIGGQTAMFRGDPPADRWDYYCRLNRKVTAQVLLVPVENFVAQVKDPSDAELRAFYDQYKDAYPDPQSPTPGFKQPFRAQFQYLKADFEKLVPEEKPKVTDDEIKKHYEEFKDDFRKVDLPAAPEKGAQDAGKDEKGSAEKSGADKSGKAGINAKQGESTTGKSGSKSGDTKSGDTKSGGQKSDAKKTDDSKKSTDRKQSSNTMPTNSLNGELLALVDGAEFEVAQAAKAPAAGGTKTAPGAKADSKADAAKAEAKKTDAKTSDAKTTDNKKSDEKTTDAKTAESGAKATETKPLEPTPVEYEPLAKVSDTIRTKLAAQRLQKRVDDAFSAVRLKMEQYRRELAKYDSEVKRGITSAKAPPAPEFKSLADQFGLELKQTDFVTVDQAEAGTDVGKSFQLASGPANPQQFREIAFNENLFKYQPEQTEDWERNRYLIWKIADEATRTPKLDEIRPDVVQAWKMIEARKPAQAKAEEYASQARQRNLALKDAIKDSSAGEVITTRPFSWLSRSLSNPMAMPRLSEVEGLKDVGDDFMEAVFALQTGQTAGGKNLHNRPQTVFYAVQIEGEEPSRTELQDNFLTSMDAPTSAAIYAVVGALDQTGLAPEPSQWLSELRREFDFKRVGGRLVATATAEEMD
jgi:hypothetical protein